MTVRRDGVARIVDCLILADGKRRLTIMIGDQVHIIDNCKIDASAGDLFLVDMNTNDLCAKIGAPTETGWQLDGDGMRWRTSNAAGQTRFDALWQRHTIRRAVRDYLDGERFIEIDTPLLVRGTTPDATIQSFSVEDRYLITSSEYQIKRLEVGGFDRVYTLTQNFRRADGEGNSRNQEFTMLEWARCGQSLLAIEQDAEQLVIRAHRA